MRDYRSCITGGTPEMVALWNNICADLEAKEAAYIVAVRGMGAKMAHPNDGWVDRENNIARPCYPYFDDGAEVGDLICLGFYTDDPKRALWGRVTKATPRSFGGREYHFDRVQAPDTAPVSPLNEPKA